jgi:hypothetical protein
VPIRVNIMVKKTRSNKKDTICKCCDHKCSTSQKLCEHFKRKNLYKPLQDQKNVAFSIQIAIQAPVQEASKQLIQEVIQEYVQTPTTVAINDTLFKDHKIKKEY